MNGQECRCEESKKEKWDLLVRYRSADRGGCSQSLLLSIG